MPEIRFLLQSDPGMRVEKNAIRRFVESNPGYTISSHSLADIATGGTNIPRIGAVPVGTVEFCQTLMKIHNINQPAPLSYPKSLEIFLGRKIEKTTWNRVRHGEFVKPAEQVKPWTGHIRGAHNSDDTAVLDTLPGNYPVWRSDVVTFISETRFYIVNNQIVGSSRYDDSENDQNADISVVNEALIAMSNQPKGMSMDFGVTDTGKTILVEVNDGWALGYYPWGNLTPAGYAKLIVERWLELCNIKK